jgi:hypothetical protein
LRRQEAGTSRERLVGSSGLPLARRHLRGEAEEEDWE